MKMKHSLRQLDELDSRISMRHFMKHNWCLNLCFIEIRKSNFFIMLPHFVLHVNPRVQLFPHSEDFEAQCEAAEIRESNPKIICATKKRPHGTPLKVPYRPGKRRLSTKTRDLCYDVSTGKEYGGNMCSGLLI